MLSQQISGRVTDESRVPLVGATVQLLELPGGVVTDQRGFYVLNLPSQGSYRLVISYVGFRADTSLVRVDKSATELEYSPVLQVTSGTLLVEVRDFRTLEKRTEVGTVRLGIEKIAEIPALLGEADVLRGLQAQPGVIQGAEGQTGLFVRGGSPDQNLILLDEVPVYNPGHILGFVSVFNPEVVNDVTFVKGGFPARYGGRLSSVVNVRTRSDPATASRRGFTLSPTLGKLHFGGKLGKKTTYFIAGRRSLFDFLLPLFNNNKDFNEPAPDSPGVLNESRQRTDFSFNDLNLALGREIGRNGRLDVRYYQGFDRFDRQTRFPFGRGSASTSEDLLNWRNRVASLNYYQAWTSRLTQRVLAGYTQYRFRTGKREEVTTRGRAPSTTFGVDYSAGVSELSLRTDFTFRASEGAELRFGGGSIGRDFTLGTFRTTIFDGRPNQEFNRDTVIKRPDIFQRENFAYLEGLLETGFGLSLNAGLHFAALDGGFSSFQPRLSLRQAIGQRTSLGLGLAAMRQHLHLVVSGSLGLPNDLWVPATQTLRPEDSRQASFQIDHELTNNWLVSLGGYYKTMENVVNYRAGLGIVSLDPWEDLLTVGTGTAYGAEFGLNRPAGRFHGSLSYTLAWSYRQFAELNQGERFPFRYDRRHNLNLVANYALKPDRWLLNLGFVYAGGNPATVANNFLFLRQPVESPSEVLTFDNVANFRLPATHRLDLGSVWRKQRPGRLREISLGVYNAYARRNPFSVNLRRDASNEPPLIRQRLVQVNLLRAVPFISYSIKWL
ncbi:MAG: TonB-dependent receptor [Lewinella sp.]|nr:TonB-dependent receptor [Lewinella sp.]